jgi:hypothetical protein
MATRKVSKVWVGLFGIMIATTVGLQVHAVRAAIPGQSNAIYVGCGGLLLAGLGAGLLDELQGAKAGSAPKQPKPPTP